MKNGTVCDQVMFGGRLFPAHGKNAPYPSERLPFGYRSAYAIDLTDHPPLRESPVQPLKTFPVLVRVSLRRRLFDTQTPRSSVPL
ncbi:hypothetical protein Plhal304r1_c053g0137301 [Plasmopara halstedii]